MKRVTLHIDRLVLHGYETASGAALAFGLRSELARLLAAPANHERVAQLRDAPVLRTERVRLAADAQRNAIGVSCARAIVRGMAP